MDDDEVRVTATDRGFHVYGEPIRTQRDEQVHLYESSNAMGPHVWLSVHTYDGTEVQLELSEDEARQLQAKMRTWLNEIPERWGR